MDKAKIKNDILAFAKQYGRDASSLLPILRAVQKKYHGISSEAIKALSEIIKDVYAVQIQSIASFYHLLNLDQKGQFILRISHCMPCEMAGADAIIAEFEKQLGIKCGKTTKDGLFTLEKTSCIGMCDHAPAMLVNDTPYVDLTPGDVSRIIKDCKANAIHSEHVIKPANSNELTFFNIEKGLGLKKALDKKPKKVIEAIINSKLRGCGGAGFPAGLKLKFTSEIESDEKYVICNADEGEPGTFKDREILSQYADFVFDGMTIAGYAIGAKKGMVYLRGEYAYLYDKLYAILKERRKKNWLGKAILGKKDFNFDIEIYLGAGAYVCGEETSLIESLEGRRGEPRNKPPFPVQCGYNHKPTVLNNVETLGWMACVMAKGADWFNKVGTEKSLGYKLFSVSGDVKRPGVYEFPMGTTIADMLKVVGGEKAKAIQAGGAAGSCIHKKQFSKRFEFDDVSPSGSVIVFGQHRDLLDAAENFMEFLTEESCGQCTPCREGTVKLLETIKLMKQGKCSKKHLDNICQLCETMQLTSKCGLGQASPNAFLSILQVRKTNGKKT